jgi:hypothetical protein
MAMIVEDAPGEVPPEVANAEEVVLMVQHFDDGHMNGVVSESKQEMAFPTHSALSMDSTDLSSPPQQENGSDGESSLARGIEIHWICQ